MVYERESWWLLTRWSKLFSFLHRNRFQQRKWRHYEQKRSKVLTDSGLQRPLAPKEIIISQQYKILWLSSFWQNLCYYTFFKKKL